VVTDFPSAVNCVIDPASLIVKHQFPEKSARKIGLITGIQSA
jgi:hypothetical protein